jgi:hypothetical protein
VIPVLVRGAKMPTAEDLPEDLKELAYRNAVELTHARWRSDVQVLLQALLPHMGDSSNGGVAAGAVAEKSAPVAAAGEPAVDAATLQRVARELATYIGPIAEIVVKRGAKRCVSAEELYALAAGEIETEADRAKFLRTCRG